MPTVSYSKQNHLTLLHRGAEFFPALIRADDAAESEIYLETYIFALDQTVNQVVAAVNRAAARGVHVLTDWLGTGAMSCAKMTSGFALTGVHFRTFNPWFRRGVARTHRKIAVVDGLIAFLGGLNINDDLLSDDGSAILLPAPRWDFAVRIVGPLVVSIHTEATAQWARQHIHTLRIRWESLKKLRASRVERAKIVAEAALVVRDNLRNRGTIQCAFCHALLCAEPW